MNDGTPDVSIIIPVCNEALGLEDLRTAILDILQASGYSYEIIFVDDGSDDLTWDTLWRFGQSSEVIKAIRFSRNFGKEAAITAGLQKARGRAAIIMDADLQHPPELLRDMISLWAREGFAVVEGVKTARQNEPLWNTFGSLFFYKILGALTGFDLRRDTDYKLLDRKVINLYLSLQEKGKFFRALIPFLGYRTGKVPFVPDVRKSGKSKFRFFKLMNLAVTAVTSFSARPLHIVTLIGIMTFIFSFFLGAHTLYTKIAGKAVEGFTTVILLILIIGSILMMALGIIGEYIAGIFDEVKKRPLFVVDKQINIKDPAVE